MKILFIKAYFLYKRFLEDDLIHLLQKYPHLTQNGNIIDVGANVGYTAVLFERFLDPDYKIFAFEPDPTNFSMLTRTINKKGLANQIHAIEKAVSDVTGNLELWHNVDHHADHKVITADLLKNVEKAHNNKITVSAITLDDFTQQQNITQSVSLIKLDVQGFELSVCAGMENILSNNSKTAIIFEFAPKDILEIGFHPDDLINFFQEHDFKLYVIGKKGAATPVEYSSFQNLVAKDNPKEIYYDILALPKGSTTTIIGK